MIYVDRNRNHSGWVRFPYLNVVLALFHQWFAGHQPEYVYQKETGESEFKWMREYGSAWRVQGCMGVRLAFSLCALSSLNFLRRIG